MPLRNALLYNVDHNFLLSKKEEDVLEWHFTVFSCKNHAKIKILSNFKDVTLISFKIKKSENPSRVIGLRSFLEVIQG